MAVPYLRWPLLLILLVLLSACEVPFEPYAETDQYFSVFGYLDVSDERQRVRVEVLQDDKPFSADTTIDATVTLTRQATGRTVALVNEPFSFQGLKHNFRTDAMNLRLDEAYRLAVQHADDEAATTAKFTTPHEVPQLSLSEDGLHATVEGGTEDQLLFLGVDYHTQIKRPPGCAPADPLCDIYGKIFELHYAERARRTETGYAATFEWEADVDSLFSGGKASIHLNKVVVDVGLVHPNMPTYEGLSYEALFRSSEIVPSNVERGVGFVAGVSDDRAVANPDPRPAVIVPLSDDR